MTMCGVCQSDPQLTDLSRRFPPCNHCGHHPRFIAVRLAQHIDHNVANIAVHLGF